MTLELFFNLLQCAVGVAITLGAYVIAAIGMDHTTRPVVRWPVGGLVVWGAWFAMVPWTPHGHDSLAAIALGLLVAVILLVCGRQVRGMLDGEEWWPGFRLPVLPSVTLEPNRVVPWYRKLNPWWVFFGNEDDGYYGDAAWRNGREQTFRLAVVWWFRNIAHNLTWYVIGLRDKTRVVHSYWGLNTHNPDGGFLWCITWWAPFGLVGLPLPFISYINKHHKLYVGWRPSGAFGFKYNRIQQGPAEVHP